MNWDIFSSRESAPGHMIYDGWEFRPARPSAEKPTDDSSESEAQKRAGDGRAALIAKAAPKVFTLF